MLYNNPAQSDRRCAAPAGRNRYTHPKNDFQLIQ